MKKDYLCNEQVFPTMLSRTDRYGMMTGVISRKGPLATMQKIDISSLQKPLTIQEAQAEFRKYSAAWKLGFAVLLLLTFVPLVIFAIFATSVLKDGGAAAFLVVFAFGGLYGLRDLYGEINENALVQRVANQNGMLFRRDFYENSYPGFPFQQQMFVPRAIRTDEPLFIEFGHLRPQHSQRRSQSAVTYTYLRIKLPKQLPHIILQRASLSSLVTFAPEGEKLRLEGEFGDRFNLFAPRDYGRDALYIFTPDLMERFIDAAKEFDCEIIGDELYFYSHKKINLARPKNLGKLFGIIDVVLQKFERQSSRYRDERITDLYAGDGVRPDRMKLRPSLFGSLTIVVFASLLVVAIVLNMYAS